MDPLQKTILHVDDDADDLFLMGEALKEADASVHILTAHDGREALSILERLGNALPALVILDINMPGMDGREALQELKNNTRWSTIPVVMLSTSSNPHDKAFCEQLGASFFTKPLLMSGMRETARALLQQARSLQSVQ